MKFYHVCVTMALLSSTQVMHSFWNTWIDTIVTKINNTTELIMHKEFDKAQLIAINNEQGAVIINSWKQKTIALEIITTAPQATIKDINIDIECIDNSIKIHTTFLDSKIKGSVLFNILVPHDTNITIKTKQGDIVVKDVYGTLDLATGAGDIKLLNPHDNLQAHTGNGLICMRTDSMQADKICNLETDKGNIEFYTTATSNTHVHACAPQGKITSDIPITLSSKTTKLDAAAWKEFRQTADGSIGTPASALHMTAHNGCIAILPYTKQNDIF
ncbi:hypothetical protein [Candidatus Chromulinivorax destructor]|uniref:Adhesin domain-containing protein n=1 Tax=Candidatus Chromulinivorax destructor TaxID=2066483 RepID=A0A345ZCL4_9BACT|nr:hypothetical protein [Candidatus Chromulinivorax destructor]AXK61031.1 hypothetical protein C0J27_04850 [Candidatus Chromulinivorax destructor]